MILRLKNKCPNSRMKRMKEELTKGIKEGLVIIPDDMEVIRVNNYGVWGRDEFIKYLLSRRLISNTVINDTWDKISKGYNFVIAIYREDINDYNIFSVNKFNELLGKEVIEEHNVKEDM